MVKTKIPYIRGTLTCINNLGSDYLKKSILNLTLPSEAATQNEDRKLVFMADYCLMQVKSIADCSKRAFCNTFDLHLATICL